MSTPNLGLEEIIITDNIQSSLLEKMNKNLEIIDKKYGELIDLLIEKTGTTSLVDAVSYVDKLPDTVDATATELNILSGYTAYVNRAKVIGKMLNKSNTSSTAQGVADEAEYKLKIPANGYYNTGSFLARSRELVLDDLGIYSVNSFSITGTYATSTYYTAAGSGYAVLPNGNVIIFIQGGTSTSYEHIYFNLTSNTANVTKVAGWDISSWDTGDPTKVIYACIIGGITGKIDISINLSTVNSSYDYVRADVTITSV